MVTNTKAKPMSQEQQKVHSIGEAEDWFVNHGGGSVMCIAGNENKVCDCYPDAREFFRSSTASPASVSTGVPSDLHHQIMNLPTPESVIAGRAARPFHENMAYLEGHRDARNAAALLVSAAASADRSGGAASDTPAGEEAEVNRLHGEVAALLEWRNSVSSAIKTIQEFHSGQWGGDKEGWGFHFEIVNFLRRDRDAASRELAELRRALEGAQAMLAKQWISVKERLPIEDQQVLVWVNDVPPYPAVWAYEAKHPYWGTIDGVTHWQPLPPAPSPQVESTDQEGQQP